MLQSANAGFGAIASLILYGIGSLQEKHPNFQAWRAMAWVRRICIISLNMSDAHCSSWEGSLQSSVSSVSTSLAHPRKFLCSSPRRSVWQTLALSATSQVTIALVPKVGNGIKSANASRIPASTCLGAMPSSRAFRTAASPHSVASSTRVLVSVRLLPDRGRDAV